MPKSFIKFSVPGRYRNVINLRPDHLAEVSSILHRYLPDSRVWAFGSRVQGTASETRDLDLVAHSENGGKLTLDLVQTAFRESNLPFSVDLFDWVTIPEHFRQEILRNYEVIQSVDG